LALTRKKNANKGKSDEEARAVSYDFARAPTLEELPQAHGVTPFESLDELKSNFWPEEETIEEFLAFLREIRSDLSLQLIGI